jgi:hypothetical protein
MGLKKFLKIIESVYYFLAALAMYCWVNVVVDEVGRKFQNLGKTLPLLLFLSGVVLLLFALHLMAHPLNARKMALTALGNGLALVLLSFTTILLITIFLLNGTYSSFLSGYLFPAYPLDAYLGSFLLLASGSLLYFWGTRLKKHPLRDYPFSVHEWTKHGKLWTSLSRPFFVLVALYFMGALLVSPMSFANAIPHLGGMIGFYLLMLLPSGMLAIYEWDYLDKQPLPKRQRLYKNSVIMTLSSLILALWFWIAQATDPQFLIEGATALLPIDFMANLKLAPYLLLLLCLSSSLIAFLHFLNRNVPKKTTKSPE